MKKRIISLIFALFLTISLLSANTAFADSEITVTINGQPVVFEGQGPAIVNGRTLIPVRGVFEALNFEVDWDGATETATLAREDYTVEVVVGQSWFTVNGIGGIGTSLDVPAQIIGGRTMLPIRAVLESVNYYVDWNESTRTVVITSAPEGVLHSFPDLGFSLEFPASWEGKFGLNELEIPNIENAGEANRLVQVYHIATRVELESEYVGGLWSFWRAVGEHYTDENLPIRAGMTIILAQAGGYTYFVNGPSDVQFNEVPGSETAAEFKRMDARIFTILNSFRLIEG